MVCRGRYKESQGGDGGRKTQGGRECMYVVCIVLAPGDPPVEVSMIFAHIIICINQSINKYMNK